MVCSHMSIIENKRISAGISLNRCSTKGNVEYADWFVTPDFIYHARGEDLIGLDKFKACVATDHTTFRDMYFTYIDGIAEGNKVSTTWILEGIQQQEFRGIPPTNKKFETVGSYHLPLWKYADKGSMVYRRRPYTGNRVRTCQD